MKLINIRELSTGTSLLFRYHSSERLSHSSNRTGLRDCLFRQTL
ncbi:MAG: hypothetical protein [Olavius algarvensis Gamma 1 endosymbiont]|nr:MAG: hypothetical protein [Olavius algarvensis Gamma 1 endosymbiont]